MLENDEIDINYLDVIIKRATIFAKYEQMKLTYIKNIYKNTLLNVEVASLELKVDGMNIYRNRLERIKDIIIELKQDKNNDLIKELFLLIDQVKHYKSEAKIGNVYLVPRNEELEALEVAIKNYLILNGVDFAEEVKASIFDKIKKRMMK